MRAHACGWYLCITPEYAENIEQFYTVACTCHILESQVKNDLTRITSSYKPEKAESTDGTRRIILNDDIPVYQPARRLSYAGKKSVTKHIEEWLEQGIVRPSLSEYTSPIVLVKNKKTFNKKRKNAPEYQVGDLDQRTQFGGEL
ncbi:transposon Ty3-I Gag-Pol polyprotein [Trichonephila clavipes]|nr:transposon Ty3-I Gag-Pol polyprotein [Trichonephila clavipes]